MVQLADGASGLQDADAAGLSKVIEDHATLLKQAAAEHLLALQRRLQSQHDAAVAAERANYKAQLEAMQAELEASNFQAQTMGRQLEHATKLLDNVAAGYGTEVQRMRDLLVAWRSWKAWVRYTHYRKVRALNQQRAVHWYQQYYLYRRVFWGWQAAAKQRYRLLVVSRHNTLLEQREQKLKQEHGAQLQQLRQQTEDLQELLEQQRRQQTQAEEDMKRAFMRGVTALNLEALQVMKRGTTTLALSNVTEVPAGEEGAEAGPASSSSTAPPAAAGGARGMPQNSVSPDPTGGGLANVPAAPWVKNEEAYGRGQTGAAIVQHSVGQLIGSPQQAASGHGAHPAAGASSSKPRVQVIRATRPAPARE